MRYILIIKDKCCSIYRRKLVMTAPLVNSLYLIDVSPYNFQMDVALKKIKQDMAL